MDAIETTCVIVGCGPAGAMLGSSLQRRRKLPTVITQTAQRAIQSGVLRPLPGGDTEIRTPRPLRLLDRFPALPVVPAHLVGIGVRPEHAPEDLDRR